MKQLRCLILALFPALAASDLAGQSIKVTLLGTGAPQPSVERSGPSTLIEAGGRKFLIDAGRGALERLTQAGLFLRDIDGVLLTHLHSDHVVGLPDLWLTGWLVRPGRARPLTLWGPRGTSSMVSHLREAFAYDIQIRQSDDGASPAGVRIPGDIMTDMGSFRIDIEIENPARPGTRVPLRNVLVDTGAELSAFRAIFWIHSVSTGGSCCDSDRQTVRFSSAGPVRHSCTRPVLRRLTKSFSVNQTTWCSSAHARSRG